MFRNSIVSILIMSSLLMISSIESFAQADAVEINTLKGLKGIGVNVEDIDTEAAVDGLSKDKLLKVITNKLKKSGIKVYTDLELRTISGQPQLVLSINPIKLPGPIYIFTVALDFNQIVLLERNTGLTSVSPTWTVLTTGGSVPEDLSKTVEAAILPMLDRFIADYNKANPK